MSAKGRARRPVRVAGAVAGAVAVAGTIAGAVAATAGTAWAAQVVTVVQKGRVFAAREVQVERGEAVRFTNEDDFPHQIAVRGAGYDFESDLQAPGGVVEVTPPSAGAFEVRCGVHPRMRMTIHVQ